MVKPQQRVIIYNGVASQAAKKKREYAQRYYEKAGKIPCPKCGNRYVDPTRNHYSDFKNKTRCM